MANKPIIQFQSYNPYEARYPGLRVVSHETLLLIKYLRTQGCTIIVTPDNGTKLNYLAEKGMREFLSDPVCAFVLNTTAAFITSLIANWLYDKLKRSPKPEDSNLMLEFDEKGRKVHYNHIGQQISDERFRSILSSLDERAQRYTDSQKVLPPESNRPYPIFLEHTSKVVGWAEKVYPDEKGLKLEGGLITDEHTLKRIQSGELKGLSIGGIVTKSECSICNSEYVNCNHIAKKKYKGKKCFVRISGILVAEISIVAEPINPLARIEFT